MYSYFKAFTTTQTKEAVGHLNRNRYIAHHFLFENITKKEAEVKWEKDFLDTSIVKVEDKHGNPQVPVE